MRKVLITGGSGSVGVAFIEAFRNQYHFSVYGRNKNNQYALKSRIKEVEIFNGSIEDEATLVDVFLKVKPDIVIHTAALKQIDVCQQKPKKAINVNLLGSLNVIKASRAARVPITIAVSSDKACSGRHVYGFTKYIMERLFLEANGKQNRFVCCRFGNVAGSKGSVIPVWAGLAKSHQALEITDIKMNRFMFSAKEAAYLLQKTIDDFQSGSPGGIYLKKLKAVNLLSLANAISSNVQIVGKRDGEVLDETLVSDDELPYTYIDGNYIVIRTVKNSSNENMLKKKLNTLDAEKMNLDEIRKLIDSVPVHEENYC